MDQDAADRLVFHLEGGGFPVLHREIHGGVIQLEALRALDFHGVVGAFLQREECTAIFVRGDGVDQLVVDLPDLEGGIRDALTGIIRIDFDDLHAADGVIVEGQGLCILGIDLNGLNPGSFVDGVSLDGLGLLDHDSTCDARNADLAVLVGGIEALAGEMAVIRVHIAAVGVGQFKLNPRKWLLRDGIQFPDDEGALGLVIEAQGLHLAGCDFNRLRGAVQDVPLHRLDFPGGNSGTGLQISDHNAAVLVGDVLAVGGPHHRAGAVRDQEGNTFQRSSRALDVLLNDQGSAGGVGEIQNLGIVWMYHHGLGLGGRIDGIAGDGLHLRYHQGAHHPVDLNKAVSVRLVDTVAGDVTVFIWHILAGGGSYLESDPLQGFASEGIPFVDDQAARLGVGDDHRLGVSALPDDYVGGGSVHHIAVRRFDLRQHISAGGQVGDVDLA